MWPAFGFFVSDLVDFHGGVRKIGFKQISGFWVFGGLGFRGLGVEGFGFDFCGLQDFRILGVVGLRRRFCKPSKRVQSGLLSLGSYKGSVQGYIGFLPGC